jgi:hypothetical protein
MALWVERITALTGMDRGTAWAEYTPILGMVTPAGWLAVREAVERGDEIGDVVEVAHCSMLEARAANLPHTRSCFWHELESDGHLVRIHFSNDEGPGVLSPARRPRRRAELSATLDDARLAAPRVERIRGGSWLYHLPGYRALFPPSFLERAIPADPRTEVTRVALWGQLLRGDGNLYRPHADHFADTARRASTVDELFAAFPLKKLDILGPLDEVTDWLSSTRGTDGFDRSA